MMQAPFIWGPNGQQLTPGQVKVLREMAAAKVAQQGTPSNLGEGLASVGNALLYNTNMGKAQEAESAGIEQVKQALAEARASGTSDGFLDVMGNEWATPGQQLIAGELYKRSIPDWQTMENDGDIVRWNANDPNAQPELWYDGPNEAADADLPSNVREWEYFNGLSPEDQDAYLRMKRSNPYLDIGTGFVQPDPTNPGMPAGPAIAKDNYGKAYDTSGGATTGKIDAERRAQLGAAEAAVMQADAKTDNVLVTIDEAIGLANGGETGLVGSVMGAVPGTRAFDLREKLKTIKANLGFAELQAMRDASPTGGALGQVAVQELESLQSTLASLNPDQSETQLEAGLARVKELLERQKQFRKAALAAKYAPLEGGQGDAPAAAGGDDIDAILSGLGI